MQEVMERGVVRVVPSNKDAVSDGALGQCFVFRGYLAHYTKMFQ